MNKLIFKTGEEREIINWYEIDSAFTTTKYFQIYNGQVYKYEEFINFNVSTFKVGLWYISEGTDWTPINTIKQVIIEDSCKPTSQWIEHSNNGYTCKNYGAYSQYKSNYCHYCGCRMNNREVKVDRKTLGSVKPGDTVTIGVRPFCILNSAVLVS